MADRFHLKRLYCTVLSLPPVAGAGTQEVLLVQARLRDRLGDRSHQMRVELSFEQETFGRF